MTALLCHQGPCHLLFFSVSVFFRNETNSSQMESERSKMSQLQMIELLVFYYKFAMRT